MTMKFIGGGAAIIGLIGGSKSAKAAEDAMKEEKKKDDLRRKKGVIEGQQRLASSTGRLNLAKRGFEVGEKEGTIGEADTNYAAGQAGRIAESLRGASPLTSERQKQFSAAGRVPESYDPMSGGSPWEMALADAQAENIDVSDERAEDLARLAAQGDLSLADQDQLNAMQRTQTELGGRQEARGTDNAEIQRRLKLESARLGFRGDIENQKLQEAYAPYLVPTYASASPLEAIGAAGSGIAEGMRRMGVGSGSSTYNPGAWGIGTGSPTFSRGLFGGSTTPGYSPTYSGIGAGGRPIGGF
tara:strand:- start:3233 stop:4132 length:900 start_codon:yes stop_codon:yes gene_type:complete